MNATAWTLLTAAAAILAVPLAAQGEEEHLPFVDGAAAFAEAARTGKRVLVYQDWPA